MIINTKKINIMINIVMIIKINIRIKSGIIGKINIRMIKNIIIIKINGKKRKNRIKNE